MSSSSSSPSRQGGRRTVYGVPSRCWCGQGLDTWVSETKENPYRRFYRCKIALQNKVETHLFKWIDEALLDKIRIVDAKRFDLLHDLQALTGKINVELECHRSWVVGRAEEMRNVINENMVQLTKEIDESTKLMKEQIDAKLNSHTSSKWPLNQTAAAVAIIGAMTYIYWKLL